MLGASCSPLSPPHPRVHPNSLRLRSLDPRAGCAAGSAPLPFRSDSASLFPPPSEGCKNRAFSPSQPRSAFLPPSLPPSMRIQSFAVLQRSRRMLAAGSGGAAGAGARSFPSLPSVPFLVPARWESCKSSLRSAPAFELCCCELAELPSAENSTLQRAPVPLCQPWRGRLCTILTYI